MDPPKSSVQLNMISLENLTPEAVSTISSIAESTNNLSGQSIEIGSWQGMASVEICKKITPNVLICVDDWKGNIHESAFTGSPHATVKAASDYDIKNAFLTHLSSRDITNYRVFHIDALDLSRFYKSPLKFIFINKDNTYDYVSSVIKAYTPLLVRGGIICGYHFMTAAQYRTDLGGGVEKAVRDNLPTYKTNGEVWWYSKLFGFGAAQ